ncbi:MAG: hypothetical protein QXE31_05465 [Candidatus Woesearchaeota archaeon]
MQKVSRREFLKILGLSGLSLFLYGCGIDPKKIQTEEPVQQKINVYPNLNAIQDPLADFYRLLRLYYDNKVLEQISNSLSYGFYMKNPEINGIEKNISSLVSFLDMSGEISVNGNHEEVFRRLKIYLDNAAISEANSIIQRNYAAIFPIISRIIISFSPLDTFADVLDAIRYVIDKKDIMGLEQSEVDNKMNLASLYIGSIFSAGTIGDLPDDINDIKRAARVFTHLDDNSELVFYIMRNNGDYVRVFKQGENFVEEAINAEKWEELILNSLKGSNNVLDVGTGSKLASKVDISSNLRVLSNGQIVALEPDPKAWREAINYILSGNPEEYTKGMQVLGSQYAVNPDSLSRLLKSGSFSGYRSVFPSDSLLESTLNPKVLEEVKNLPNGGVIFQNWTPIPSRALFALETGIQGFPNEFLGYLAGKFGVKTNQEALQKLAELYRWRWSNNPDDVAKYVAWVKNNPTLWEEYFKTLGYNARLAIGDELYELGTSFAGANTLNLRQLGITINLPQTIVDIYR